MNVYYAEKGESIISAVKNAKKKLKDENYEDGKLEFNDVMIPLSVNSVVDDIVLLWYYVREVKVLKSK